MSLMKGRQDPSPAQAESEKEGYLETFRSLLGAEWLSKDEEHPIRTLWRRRDWLATVELFTLGDALQKMGPRAQKKVLKEAAEDLKIDNFLNRSGKIVEILGAAIFHDDTHPVDMATAGQAGFDFVINLPNQKKIRVSSKALLTSAKEIEFHRFANKLHEHHVAGAIKGVGSFLGLFLLDAKGPSRLELDPLKTLIDQVNGNAFNKELAFNYKDWFAKLRRESPADGEVFWNQVASYTFLVLSPHLGDEQKRFHDKVEGAVANMKRHCSEVNQQVNNLIFMKIPTAVSLPQAKDWLKEYWDDSSSHIAGIFIYRTNVISTEDLSQSMVVHEFALVDNPFAAIPIKDMLPENFKFNFSVPLGSVATEESDLKIRIDDKEIKLNGNYCYIRGHHYYYRKFEGTLEFKLQRLPFIKQSMVVSGLAPGPDQIISMVAPNEDSLVVI